MSGEVLDPQGFARLPEARKERLRLMLKVRGIDWHHVARIVKHTHTWDVEVYDPWPPQVSDGDLMTRTIRTHGGRW